MKIAILNACRLKVNQGAVYLFGRTVHWLILALAHGLEAMAWMGEARKTGRGWLTSFARHLPFPAAKLHSLLGSSPQ